MNLLDNILFWRKKKENEEINIPYRPGYGPSENNFNVIPVVNDDIWSSLKPIDLAKIETIDFPKEQYFQEVYEKKQIYIHHTLGNSVDGVISEWLSTADRVGTCIVIDRAGIPFQLFSSKYWAAHLKAGNLNLDRHSIAIELVNWGQLTLLPNGKYKTYYGNQIYTQTEYYPNGFRGYNYFEKYTEAQLITLGELLLYWNKVYKIPLTYEESIWDVTQDALSGTPGVFGHVSVRPYPAKSDPHPQKELKEMLTSLSKR